jgi:protein-S-isoprenylcysteine O-methyltransferase Ste14
MGMLLLDAVLLGFGVGGAQALLRHPRAVGLLIVWAAGYGALGGLPRGPRNRAPRHVVDRLVLALLVLVPLVTPMLSAWGERIGLWPLAGGPALRWSGVVLAGAGFLLRILAIQRLGVRFSPLVETRPGHTLETGGVYGRIRHPGYTGAWLANLGAILAFGSAATLLLAAILAAALVARVRREEATLEEAFGQEYRDYRQRTGAFWPRLGS